MNSQDVRDGVNRKLIEAMSQNVLPWRRPWSDAPAGRHRNFTSKHVYSGVNPPTCGIRCGKSNFSRTFGRRRF